jgi:hypothetical protein
MKITKNELKEIIREELKKLSETSPYPISEVSDSFITKSQELIDDTKKLKGDYPINQYNKIMDLEKLIYSDSKDDRKKFVKSIMRLLGMTKWDLPNELYRYL